jgi:drug/metabolite transporter (DMT)-like permease
MKPAVSELQAIGFALAGFTFWVLTDSSVKLVGNALPPYEVLAFLGLSVSGFLFLRALWRRDLAALWPRRKGRQLVRSLLDLANNFGVVIAVRHIPLTLFYILVFCAPMVISILEAIFLGERLTWRKGLAIAGGFGGVVVAVDPLSRSQGANWIGVAACMVCVACFSVNMVWSRVITRTETAESLTLFSGLVMTVAGFALMLWHAAPLTGRLVSILVAMGAFCTLGTMSYFIALKHTTAANVSQYHYTQLLTGAIVAYLVWREVPTPSMFAGSVLIVASGLYVAFAARREHAGRLEPPPGAPILPD